MLENPGLGWTQGTWGGWWLLTEWAPGGGVRVGVENMAGKREQEPGDINQDTVLKDKNIR